MTHHFTVKIARSLSELEDIRRYWVAWQNHLLADFDLYLNTLEKAPNCLRPHVMLLLRDEFPTAMLAGTFEEYAMRVNLGFWKVRGPKTRVLSFAYGGVLGDEGQESVELFVREIITCLKNNEADVAILHNVKEGSQLYHLALRMPGFLRRDHMPSSEAHYSMDLPEKRELIYQRLSHKHRQAMRRTAKKFASTYGDGIRLTQYLTETDVQRLIEEAEKVARKTYQRYLGVGFSPSKVITERLRIAAKRNWLRAYLLTVSSEPCAFVIGILYQGVFHLEYVAYDPAFAEYSPGTVLITNVMEVLCAEHVREYDFGFGTEQYKERFGNRKIHESRIHIFGTSVRGLTVNMLKTCGMLLTAMVRSLLERTKLFSKLKTKWRTRLKKRQLALANAKSK